MDGARILTRRIRLSRWINRRLGGQDEMLCARAHREEWRAFVVVVDVVFVLALRRRHRHCESARRWEELVGRKLTSLK